MSEIMHSYTFDIVIGAKNKAVSFFINSYRHQDRRLLEVRTATLEKILSDVIRDEVRRITVERGEAS
jgi:hypothetical protein